MKHPSLGLIAAAAALLLTTGAQAAIPYERVQTGGSGDLTWEARSLIVGMTPTAGGSGPRFPGAGDPLFSNNLGAYTGVVPIIMNFGASAFICSATLLPDRQSLLTAAHCVSDGAGTPGPDLTTAFFFENLGPSDRPPTDAGSTPITISQIFVNPQYSGQVIDHNDIAVLRLSAPAPSWAQSYEMSFAGSLRGQDFTVAGYGNRSLVGGGGPSGGATGGTTGFLRHGDNMFDYRFGDPVFGTNWYGVIGPQSRTEFSYVSDFDSGLAANDQSCLIAQASNIGGAAGAVFCDTGRGPTEVGVAGGDSGGPQFNAAGQIVSVTSYGLSFGVNFGDCRTGLQSSCGEMNGFVPLYIHEDFIMSSMIPEPGTWALLIGGLGLVGAAARRQRRRDAA